MAKAKKFLSITLFTMAAVLCAAGVACSKKSNTQTTNVSDLLKDAPKFVSKEIIDFSEDTSLIFSESDGYSNGDVFGVEWSKDNVLYNSEDNTMALTITKSGDKYYGGEIRTIGTVGSVQYGYFGCEMKPSNIVGTASTFFTYVQDPHDEIDIEFLGQNTTKVQFNYFVNGVGGHEYMYELGFDASAEYHQYGFYWDEDTIIWYVDNVPVYAVQGEVPSHPQQLYTNVWAGDKTNEGIIGWMGNLSDDDLPAKVSYRSLTVAYLNGSGLDVPIPEYVPNISDFTLTSVLFDKGTADIYRKENNTITYENLTLRNKDGVMKPTYSNVYGVVGDDIKAANYVALKIKNNGTEDNVVVRIDVQADTKNKLGIKAINEKAWQDGETVKTDLTYGGSFFTIKPGQESICIIKYNGLPSNILLMIDSTRSDKESYSGSITISEVLYAGTNDYVNSGNTGDNSNTDTNNGNNTGDNSNTDTNNGNNTGDNGNTDTNNGNNTGDNSNTENNTGNSESVDHSTETLTICEDNSDLFNTNNLVSTPNGTVANETINTYGTSKQSFAWSGVTQWQNMLLYASLDKSTLTITKDGYIEFFIKDTGHTSDAKERASGIYLRLYNGSDKVSGSKDVKAYNGSSEEYNSDYRKDAGNDWSYYKLPLTLFGSLGALFDSIRIFANVNFDSSEVMYLDGLQVVIDVTNDNTIDNTVDNSGNVGDSSGDNSGDNLDNNTVDNSSNTGDNLGDNTGDNSNGSNNSNNGDGVDHSAETLTICEDNSDLFNTSNLVSIPNGTVANETINTYGTSKQSFAWSGLSAYQNMFIYTSLDHSVTTITTDGYVEFFIKDTGHTSDTKECASGVVLRLYNGSSNDKVAGVQDVKAYYGSSGDYNAQYRTDGGNGWSYYKLPLTLFGSLGASFDRIRFAVNANFDDGEVMYLDGLQVVTTVNSDNTDNTTSYNIGNRGSVDHSAETLAICADNTDLFITSNFVSDPNGTMKVENVNTYGTSKQSLAWSDLPAYQNMYLYVSLDKSPLTITKDGYIEFFIKDTGHTSDTKERASGVNLVLYSGSNKVNTTNVSVYKTHNDEYRTDAGNGWSRYQLPLTLFGDEGTLFEKIRFASNVAFDAGEVMYLDGLQVVVNSAELSTSSIQKTDAVSNLNSISKEENCYIIKFWKRYSQEYLFIY